MPLIDLFEQNHSKNRSWQLGGFVRGKHHCLKYGEKTSLIDALGEEPVPSRRQVTRIIEVLCDLTVRAATGPQRQHCVKQRLLVIAQRSNI
jgi:hypothetical protein